MAYDEGLAERIRSVLEGRPKVTEKKMFGGVAFLLDGKMFVGLAKGELMVRIGPDRYPAAIKERHVRPMDFTGKPMIGYVFVAPEGVEEDVELERWVRFGAEFVATMPSKKSAGTRSPKVASTAMRASKTRSGKVRRTRPR
jgi:TfoX/Sxy family transcriptional regulator of competence genes